MNWGNKLLLTFVVFGAGMSFLVYKAINSDFELVDKDYYKKELRYQEVIDNTRNANALSDVVKLSQSAQGIQLQMPPEMANQKVTGSAYFYCAYSAGKDREYELNPDSRGSQLLDIKHLAPGDYTVKISWAANSKSYYAERTLTVK